MGGHPKQDGAQAVSKEAHQPSGNGAAPDEHTKLRLGTQAVHAGERGPRMGIAGKPVALRRDGSARCDGLVWVDGWF